MQPKEWQHTLHQDVRLSRCCRDQQTAEQAAAFLRCLQTGLCSGFRGMLLYSGHVRMVLA